MEKLREDITNVIADLNKAWIKEINDAVADNRGIDMSLKGQYSDFITVLNKNVNDAKLRQKPKSKGWF